MDEQNPDVVESLNPQEDIVEQTIETAEESETSQPDPEIEELKKRAALADDYKKRAEKAEREAKSLKSKDVHSQDGLSNRDVLILAKANLSAEDVDEVLEYARFKKIAVADALKAPVISTLLAEREEERKTASATQTRGSARGTAKVLGEEILIRAERTGEVPDSDEGMAELFKARLARRLPKKH